MQVKGIPSNEPIVGSVHKIGRRVEVSVEQIVPEEERKKSTLLGIPVTIRFQ